MFNSLYFTSLFLYVTTSFSRALIFPSRVAQKDISVSTDPEYPHKFTGRLCFLPSIVKVKSSPGASAQPLSIFGYSLGGVVALEYDTSPVGYYREYVTMSSLVAKRGCIGQWGSRLYVSTREAEEVCRKLWGVPAEMANIEFKEIGDKLKNSRPPNPQSPFSQTQTIGIEGWKNTRILTKKDLNTTVKRFGGINILWTPTIKALWLPVIPFESSQDKNETEDRLPTHKLRLAASAIRLHYFGFERIPKNEDYSEEIYNLGIPLGIGLIVDNVSIEIGAVNSETL
jgi:hypothetical protein